MSNVFNFDSVLFVSFLTFVKRLKVLQFLALYKYHITLHYIISLMRAIITTTIQIGAKHHTDRQGHESVSTIIEMETKVPIETIVMTEVKNKNRFYSNRNDCNYNRGHDYSRGRLQQRKMVWRRPKPEH